MEITQSEYDKLVADQQMLRALECAGVDNWEGSSFAMDLLDEWNEKDQSKEELV